MKILNPYKIALICAGLLLATGCERIENVQDNPNNPTHITPQYLLTSIETNAFNNVDFGAARASRHLTYVGGIDAQQYYNWTRASFDDYIRIKNLVKMEEEATAANAPVYKSLAKFLKSYYFVKLTETFGDVPYSEASIPETKEPKYDDQKAIFISVLDNLKAANQELRDSNELIAGDVIYHGDKLKWRKLINSFALRVLMDLSKKETDAEVNVKSRFAEIVNNPSQFPIFETYDDGAFLKFENVAGNRYPHFNDNDMNLAVYIEQSFSTKLKNLKDPRLFVFAEKMTNTIGANPADPFSYYDGIYASGDPGSNSQKASAGLASKIKSRYYNDPVNEPGMMMGYSELQFILAEAAARGWISQVANQFYLNGIKASMRFYKISDADAAAYVAQSSVQLGGNPLQQILTQKHISMFMNTGWQPFFDQRRTGMPTFNVDGAGVLNGGKIPKRWMYPDSERQYNTANLNAAVVKQYPTGDNINEIMWLIK